jgi:NDP-sugar pyrophosphorylase family protein
MTVDNCLILGAGYGTRMGEIGKILPKILWPVFDSCILDLQIKYAHSLGAKNVFVNTHYLHESIQDYVSQHNLNVTLLHESELLYSGGAIHNIARKLNYEGKLFINNGDQFLFFDNDVLSSAFIQSDGCDSLLIGIEVNSDEKYNALEIKDDLLRGIIKNNIIPKNKKIITYSGMGIINLESLDKVDGASKFFETVCNFESSEVRVKNITEYEYWDFGTTDRYSKSIEAIIKKSGTKFHKFLSSSCDVNTYLKENDSIKIGELEIFKERVLYNGVISMR